MASIPDVGDTAPDFTLQSTEGEITLSKRLKGGAECARWPQARRAEPVGDADLWPAAHQAFG
jgi:hypothetical protein